MIFEQSWVIAAGTPRGQNFQFSDFPPNLARAWAVHGVSYRRTGTRLASVFGSILILASLGWDGIAVTLSMPLLCMVCPVQPGGSCSSCTRQKSLWQRRISDACARARRGREGQRASFFTTKVRVASVSACGKRHEILVGVLVRCTYQVR